jgi:hypothetical protein
VWTDTNNSSAIIIGKKADGTEGGTSVNFGMNGATICSYVCLRISD